MNPLHLFFSTQGRVARGTYWSVVGIWFLISLLFRGGVSAAANWSGNEQVVAVFFWASVLFSLVSYFPMAALLVKRLHDSGRSGWWLLFQHIATLSVMLMVVAFTKMASGALLFLALITLPCGLGMLVVFVFSLWPSDDGQNEYGFA
jgi:uncharacterized membrane protein YhaH (DUF805 family)